MLLGFTIQLSYTNNMFSCILRPNQTKPPSGPHSAAVLVCGKGISGGRVLVPVLDVWTPHYAQ